MIEPRLYRIAFIPAVLAVVIAAFSLQSRPAPLPADPSADVLFDGDEATASARDLAEQFPDRAAGTADDRALADRLGQVLAGYGFEVALDRFEEEGTPLVNVVATRPGAIRRKLVVMAPRDPGPTAGELAGIADTAALLEIGRALEGRASEMTIVLVSYDGSALGAAGVRRYVETADSREPIGAALTLSNLGARPPARPQVVAFSDGQTIGSGVLARSAIEALQGELGGVPGEPGLFGQFARLALPIAPGAQGVLLDRGVDAVRVSGSGELPPVALGEVDEDRLGAVGRAVLQTIVAVDSAPAIERDSSRYMRIGRKLLPGWAISILALALIAPALLASIDASARARRRREPLGAWLVWVGRSCLAAAAAIAVAVVAVTLGLTDVTGGVAPIPASVPFGVGPAALLLTSAAAAIAAWLALGTQRAIRRGARSDPRVGGAGVATSLVLALVVLATWVVNPFSALVLVAPLHLWMLATLGDADLGARTRAVLFGLGLVPAGLIAVYYLVALGLDPLQGAWYLLLLLAGGPVGFGGVLLGALLGGVTTAVVAILIVQSRTAGSDPSPVSRGPPTYAGPGSLGGVRSALRRDR